MKLSRIFVRDAQTQRLAGEWGVARTRTCAMHPRQIWLIELHAQWRTYDFQIGCSDLVALSHNGSVSTGCGQNKGKRWLRIKKIGPILQSLKWGSIFRITILKRSVDAIAP
jgi:hypothetical protein